MTSLTTIGNLSTATVPPSEEYPISPGLQRLLQHVANDVVARLDCVGVMVATVEMGHAVPLRAIGLNFNPQLLNQLEEQAGIKLLSSESIVYLDDKKYRHNLGVQAVQQVPSQADKYLVSDDLHDLLRPFVDHNISDLAQQALGIRQVIAVPFFLDDEVVGNLFAMAKEPFSQRDIDFLLAFGKQAATAIQSHWHLSETQALERVILALQTSMTDETQVLQTIVDAVVQKMGYAGAMVATLEDNNALPVRSFSFGFAPELLRQLEKRLGISPIGPNSVVYLDDEKYKDNLSVRAVRGADGHPVKYLTSDRLHDLFRPIVGKTLSDIAQKLVGIKQVIAVPFFLEDELVGNLFAATRKNRFSEREIEMLTTFGQQAAVGIRNARLYRRAEEQRQIAQMFARMAFSAAANVHALRNHIGAFRTYLGLIQMTANMDEERRMRILNSSDEVLERLNESANILDHLHTPWQQKADVPTDVNSCVIWAVREVLPNAQFEMAGNKIETEDGLTLHKNLAEVLPPIKTSPDMLTEAFRIVLKNAVEAIREYNKGSNLWITTRTSTDGQVQISIKDDGIGIKPNHLTKIFDMGWTSKGGRGMGFGLFWTRDYISGLDGTIDVESTWQEGTEFIISIPPTPE